MTAPDNTVTTYDYAGNTVKITTPAPSTGNTSRTTWKKYTRDAFGNLTQVDEPDPQLGTVSTTYACDGLNHLIQVTMPRGGVTQTRSFNYNVGNSITGYLQSSTNPENGSVSYGYNSDGTLAWKLDATYPGGLGCIAKQLELCRAVQPRSKCSCPGCAAFAIGNNQDPQAYFTETLIAPDANNPGYVINAITRPTTFAMIGGAVYNTGTYSHVVTAFNFYPGAPFNSATVTANATTVLHELGHIYEDLYGLGSTFLVNDSVEAQGSRAASNAASAFNTKLIQANCFPGGH